MATFREDPDRPVEHLLSLSDDDLYLELGNLVLGVGPGASPQDPEANRRFGVQWFKSRRDEFRNAVCMNERVIAVRHTSENEKLIAVATIADAVATMIGMPAATVVSVLIIRLGLDSFCG